jgi:two-component system response regulator YesN
MSSKILIIDDDPVFRSEFKEFLEGYDVIEASDGRQALAILKKAHEIALVILDVRLPGLSGTDVLRQIKKSDPQVSIVILTGYGSKDVAIEALKGRADDFIEKPLDVHKVGAILRKFVDDDCRRKNIDASGLGGKIEKAKLFAEMNCCKKLSLKEVAESVCLSPKYLSRVFKQQTGTGFNDFKLKLKIREARRLLAKSSWNINEISRRLGYENTESFIRQFKKWAGKTPAAYRQKIKK